MAGVEQGNVSNEESMEEIARYECVYHRNSKDFKDKNKKANCWKKIGEKFNLSAMLFAAIFLTLPLTEMYATVGSAIVCDCLRLYRINSLCDRLRSAIRDPRSSAIVCDHMETSLMRGNKRGEFAV